MDFVDQVIRILSESKLCSRTTSVTLRVKWRHSNLWSRDDTISMLQCMMSYCAKLNGENLSRYLNETESVGLRKAYSSFRSAIWLQVLQNVYISLPYNMAARTAVIDRNVEITSLSPYLQAYHCAFWHLLVGATKVEVSRRFELIWVLSNFAVYLVPLNVIRNK